MTHEEKMETASYIRANISKEALLEMLAEEASELAKAALKLARITRCENPTPISSDQATSELLEEWSDVLLCGDILQLLNYPAMTEMKLERWKRRINMCKADPATALKYHFKKPPKTVMAPPVDRLIDVLEGLDRVSQQLGWEETEVKS